MFLSFQTVQTQACQITLKKECVTLGNPVTPRFPNIKISYENQSFQHKRNVTLLFKNRK